MLTLIQRGVPWFDCTHTVNVSTASPLLDRTATLQRIRHQTLLLSSRPCNTSWHGRPITSAAVAQHPLGGRVQKDDALVSIDHICTIGAAIPASKSRSISPISAKRQPGCQLPVPVYSLIRPQDMQIVPSLL